MLHILSAVQAEANPLIESFGLSVQKYSGLFNIYLNEEHTISLTISGIGKISCAAAIGSVHTFLQTNKTDAWLNIGIAGHGHCELGQGFLVNRVIDGDTNKNWYPAFVFDSPLPQQTCQTVSKVSKDYHNHLLDMEASAFMEMTARLTKMELIHSIKIVSDNDAKSLKKINKDLAEKLIQQNIESIQTVTESLLALSNELNHLQKPPKFYEEFLHSWHFSETQSNILHKELLRWQLLKPEENPFQVFKQSSNSKTILLEMGNILDNSEFRYDR